jgi:hypothetical protein
MRRISTPLEVNQILIVRSKTHSEDSKFVAADNQGWSLWENSHIMGGQTLAI